jgi:DNA-binding GntR family transcriptional regulator
MTKEVTMSRRKLDTVALPRPEEAGTSPLSAVIRAWLHSSIISGAFAPGHVLRQEELAARFNTSRVPLRDALQHLQAEGLVMLRPRRGYAVTSLQTTELVELMQLRMLIEGHAGYTATLVRTERDVKALEACLRDMDKLPVKVSTEAQRLRWSVLNRRFHDTLFAAGGRAHLQKIASNISSKVEPYILMEIAITHELMEAHADHHQIFAAFKAGDAHDVSVLSRRHCERTAIRFIEALQGKGLVPELTPKQVTDLGPAVSVEEAPRLRKPRVA